MGIFNNDTEEEKQRKKLIKAIRNSNLNEEWKNYLINYVNGVYEGTKKNRFLTIDNLIEVIASILETDVTYKDPETEFNKYVETISYLLPMGEQTEEAESKLRMFLDNFIGRNGILNQNLFDKTFYTLFANRYDYLSIINMIRNDQDLSSDAPYIFDYASKVSPYCSNRETFKNEIISYINGLKHAVDYDEYSEELLSNAKKRCGIYPIDEKTLAIISSEAEKAQGLIEKLQVMQEKVTTYTDTVNEMTKTGKKDIRDTVAKGKKDIGAYATEAIGKMQESIKTEVDATREMLDQYLLTLEAALKQSSDKVFNDILEKSATRIREIKVAADSLSSTTTSELLRIKNATEDSVTKLKDYVENEPQLQELLNNAASDDKIREALLTFQSLQTTAATQAVVAQAPTTGVIIPGNERLVMPANSKVVIPESGIVSTIIPAFDRGIPYKERFHRIMDEKHRREDQGEIFHSVTDEVISCLLENDWPYLWGPSGCGKSYTIRQIAELIGLDLIDNGKITDKFSLMAYNDPHGNFRATQAFVAVVYGKLLLLDEFDNGNTDTQVLLNEFYSGSLDVLEKPNKPRYVTFAEDMTVPIHPNFRMISAGNTTGEGENQVYSSRGKSDESVQERMTPIFVNYDNRIEQRIFGQYTEWYDFFIKFRQACDEYAVSEGLDTVPGIGTTRDAAAITRYIENESKSVDEIIRQKFVQTKSASYLRFLSNAMKRYYGIERVSDPEYNGTLAEIPSKVLGKKFIYKCNEAAKSKRD